MARTIAVLVLGLGLFADANAQSSFKIVPGLMHGSAPKVLVDALVPSSRLSRAGAVTTTALSSKYRTTSLALGATANPFGRAGQLATNDDPNCDELGGSDKWFHVGTFFVGTLGIYLVFKGLFKLPKAASYILAAATATALGIAREISDRNSDKNCFSEQDLLANSAGILAAGIVIAIF